MNRLRTTSMNVTYLLNVKSGDYILSNLVSTSDSGKAFIKDNKLEGYTVETVLIADNEWHRVKATIDVNNERLRTNMLAASGQLPAVKKDPVVDPERVDTQTAPDKHKLNQTTIDAFKEEFKQKTEALKSIETQLEANPDDTNLGLARSGLIARIAYVDAQLNTPTITKSPRLTGEALRAAQVTTGVDATATGTEVNSGGVVKGAGIAGTVKKAGEDSAVPAGKMRVSAAAKLLKKS